MNTPGIYKGLETKVIVAPSKVWMSIDNTLPVGLRVDKDKYKEGDVILAGSMLVFNYEKDCAEVITKDDVDKLDRVLGLTQNDIYIGKNTITITTSCVIKGMVVASLIPKVPKVVIDKLKGITFVDVFARENEGIGDFNDDFNNSFFKNTLNV